MDKTKTWQDYEKGIDYKNRIGLYSAGDRNERIFAGDQWAGIPHEGIPTPVTNFIKYGCAWKIASVTDRRTAMTLKAEGENDGTPISVYTDQLSTYCDTLWERLKMDYLTKEGLKQACITGDYVQYFYWDNSINTGQAYKGDIATHLIDNVNYYPGDPNNPNVQEQPYIILAFREHITKVKEKAEKNGVSRDKMKLITGDEETENTAGDRGKIELEDSSKINVLLKMYKKDAWRVKWVVGEQPHSKILKTKKEANTLQEQLFEQKIKSSIEKKKYVYSETSTRAVVIQKDHLTKLTQYPVALMNWDTRKNSCHGESEVTYLISNQVFTNKKQALDQVYQVNLSNPKVIYDTTRVKKYTNKVGGAIPVNGDIHNAVDFANPPSTSYDAWTSIDKTIDTTLRMMGATPAALGEIKNPDNTSAFIAVREAALIPIQNIQERFYEFLEQVGTIWVDFIQHFYTNGRTIPVSDEEGNFTQVPIDTEILEQATLRMKIDVGPSTMWSEIQTIRTLDNLLEKGAITLKQYLERVPDGYIPKKEQLIKEVEDHEAQQIEQMQGLIEQLKKYAPPEIQAQLPQ